LYEFAVEVDTAADKARVDMVVYTAADRAEDRVAGLGEEDNWT